MSSRLFRMIPLGTENRIRSNRASRAVVAAAGVVAGVSVAVLAGATWIDVQSRAQLALSQKEGAPVLRIEQEIDALRAVETQLGKSLALQRSLGVTIQANGVIRAVADALPKGALIKSITLDYQNVQGSNRKQRKGAKEPENGAPRVLSCVIEGIAADDSDVGAIVDGLGKLKALSKVTLESSRSYEFRGKNAREYKVTFVADLEKRWKLPQIVSATETREAKP